MNWIKNVVVDIIVTLFIAVAVWLRIPWMWWAIAIYTALMLIAKIIALTGAGFMSRTAKLAEAPKWFLHLLYLLNVILLFYAGWWYLFGGWCLIWVLSYISEQQHKS